MPDRVGRSEASDRAYGGVVTGAVRNIEDPAVRRTVLTWIPWRAEGREVFACIDPEDVEGVNDEKIGIMLEANLADEAVAAHNAALKRVDQDA